jgi:hypothetical protein
MSLAVDNSILNNHFEEPKEYRIYEEGQSKRMSDRGPARYYFRTGKLTYAIPKSDTIILRKIIIV